MDGERAGRRPDAMLGRLLLLCVAVDHFILGPETFVIIIIIMIIIIIVKSHTKEHAERKLSGGNSEGAVPNKRPNHPCLHACRGELHGGLIVHTRGKD